jgi:hypothetical protein
MFFFSLHPGRGKEVLEKTLSPPPPRNRRFIFVAPLCYKFRVSLPEQLEEIFGQQEEEPNETV